MLNVCKVPQSTTPLTLANLKNGRGSSLKYWMSNMAWGSGSSGNSWESLAYTPSGERKSGMPQDTEIWGMQEIHMQCGHCERDRTNPSSAENQNVGGRLNEIHHLLHGADVGKPHPRRGCGQHLQ